MTVGDGFHGLLLGGGRGAAFLKREINPSMNMSY
jgi:hypothetical protein